MVNQFSQFKLRYWTFNRRERRIKNDESSNQIYFRLTLKTDIYKQIKQQKSSHISFKTISKLRFMYMYRKKQSSQSSPGNIRE